jgi:hypothetical protein
MSKTHAVRIAGLQGGSSPLARVCGRLAVLALAGALAGCSGNPVTGTAGGEGSVDLSSSLEKAKTNPDIAKAAALRGRGLGGSPLEKKSTK